MPKLLLSVFLALHFLSGWAQSRTLSLGVFTGITSSYTYDQGIIKDQRYQNRYNIKLAPIGINYEIDFENVGFLISPGITTIGQNFYVVNTTGGHEGERKINLTYLNIPIACKVRLIDMSFFKVSFLGSVSPAYLLNGKETVSHNDSKLKFIDEIVPPVLPPDYIREYDGVLSPVVKDYIMLTKNDFNPFQLFVGAGFRSDWDATDSWRISFDLRANYGLLESRTSAYLAKVKTYQTLYDLSGTRRDMFIQFTIGIAKYVELERKDREKSKSINGTPKRRTPRKYPWGKPRSSKSRG
jgi:hypothetical protein